MSFIYAVFAYPAAQMAAFFWGAELQWLKGEEIRILISPQPIQVTASCSGFGFFSLFYIYIVFYVVRYCQRSRMWAAVLIPLPAVYLATVVTNAARMICAYHIARVSGAWLPSFFQPIIHMGVGVAFFLGVFIVSTLLLERILPYGRQS